MRTRGRCGGTCCATRGKGTSSQGKLEVNGRRTPRLVDKRWRRRMEEEEEEGYHSFSVKYHTIPFY